MAVGDLFGGLFGKGSSKELAEPLRRRARIEAAWDESRKVAASGGTVEEIRRPFMALGEEFLAAKQDAAEVFEFVHKAVPADPYWRMKLVQELLKRPRLQR